MKVNNSTNINKTNNNLSPKESINSDGQQFYQYQQSERSPFILAELTEHTMKSRHMDDFDAKKISNESRKICSL